MKNSKVLKSILFISGLIGVGIGAAILLTPTAMFALNGVDLGGNISLLNEIRAPGGAILACGILIMLGVFVEELTFTATIISALLYLSYGISRVLSVVIDGKPAAGLVIVAGLEIIIGLVCAFALAKYREHKDIPLTSG